MGIAALVLGIVALVLGIFGLGFPFGTIEGVLGVIFGALGRRKEENRGLATAGLVCAIIGTVLSVIFFLACASCIGSTAMLF